MATEISNAVSVPLFTKDEIKIEILKKFGKKDRAWDVQVGIMAVQFQIQVAENLLAKNQCVILESNYKEEFDAPLLRHLLEKTSAKCLQIVCGAEGSVLIERFRQRETTPERDALYFPTNVEEFIPKLKKGFNDPLRLPGKVISVDTTDFFRVELASIIDSVRDFLG